ncbi:MAG: hypothetical protein JWL96_1297 [Sphingomonas bacterium]|uniref:DUF7668 domain-containing protein n=1 Tax=Sphingomonas bacterium TaxID=1895847 RepID=UPI002619D8AC|nr:hypothetical protein [Sphingomonas bacterium]MDB5709227.1 hypothetical protein [Sphingomonas bacterium]
METIANLGVQAVSEPVPILKDEEHEHPVPSEWRPKLRDIAGAFKDGNYGLRGLADVDPLDGHKATQIARYIEDYGCTLISLSDESWDTSVCQWQLDYWEVLVDLFTVEEGRSDLVLHVHVFEDTGRFLFKVHLVYVP